GEAIVVRVTVCHRQSPPILPAAGSTSARETTCSARSPRTSRAPRSRGAPLSLVGRCRWPARGTRPFARSPQQHTSAPDNDTHIDGLLQDVQGTHNRRERAREEVQRRTEELHDAIRAAVATQANPLPRVARSGEDSSPLGGRKSQTGLQVTSEGF